MTVWIGTADDEHWMRHAMTLAERAQREFDEIPVGAVLVGADGQDIRSERASAKSAATRRWMPPRAS